MLDIGFDREQRKDFLLLIKCSVSKFQDVIIKYHVVVSPVYHHKMLYNINCENVHDNLVGLVNAGHRGIVLAGSNVKLNYNKSGVMYYCMYSTLKWL